MPSLEESLGHLAAVINAGPGALDASRFAGDADRVLLGLKAHANTVSHARLVALEQTFPLTREEIGEEKFNYLSRLYIETALAKTVDIAQIGENFPSFLRKKKISLSLIQLAEVEYMWLQSYHALDAVSLDIESVQKYSEAALLGLKVKLHPAVRLCPVSMPLAEGLAHLGDMESSISAVLVTRPDNDVMVNPVDRTTQKMAEKCIAPTLVSDLLTPSRSRSDIDTCIDSFIKLVSFGALMNAN